jgi:hypothetical protein
MPALRSALSLGPRKNFKRNYCRMKPPISYEEIGGVIQINPCRIGVKVVSPKACWMGSQKPISNPTTPKQPQHTTTTTRMAMIQGFVFLGETKGG